MHLVKHSFQSRGIEHLKCSPKRLLGTSCSEHCLLKESVRSSSMINCLAVLRQAQILVTPTLKLASVGGLEPRLFRVHTTPEIEHSWLENGPGVKMYLFPIKQWGFSSLLCDRLPEGRSFDQLVNSICPLSQRLMVQCSSGTCQLSHGQKTRFRRLSMSHPACLIGILIVVYEIIPI